MKKILCFLTLFICGTSLFSQIDRSKQPIPGPSPEIKFKDPNEFKLNNGLTVLIIEDKKLPRVSARLTTDIPMIYEGSKAGSLAIFNQMHGNGSKNISKDDFEEEIDFLGATISLSISGAFASSLSRYFPRILELMSDGIINPNFSQNEFEKEKEKLLEQIKASEKDVETVARRVENFLSYGANHPYGEYVSKETVENVSLEDIKTIYDNYVTPNNSYLVIVGDIDYKKVKKEVEVLFSKWKLKDLLNKSFPEPFNPNEIEINFVNMDNAVQSEISLINTASLDKANPDYFAVLVANQILGGGSEARLHQNLREGKGYTYGSYSVFNDSHKTKARFRAFASVRNSVTDSAIIEMINEIDFLRKNPVKTEELNLVKSKYAGAFVRTLEDPGTIANFIITTRTQKLPESFYKDFLKNLNEVSVEDVQRVSKKYFTIDNARIIITGKGKEVMNGIEKIYFNKNSIPVKYFDKFGAEIARPEFSKIIPEGITSSDVIKNYIKAIGGKERLSKINSKEVISEAMIQGMKLEVRNVETLKKQMSMEISMMGNLMQKQVVNDSIGYNEIQGKKIPMGKEDIYKIIGEENILFPEFNVNTSKLELLGIVNIDGEEAYEIKWSESKTNYYSINSFLKIKSVEIIESPEGTISNESFYTDYKEFGKILFPHKLIQNIGPQKVEFFVKSITLNKPYPESFFR